MPSESRVKATSSASWHALAAAAKLFSKGIMEVTLRPLERSIQNSVRFNLLGMSLTDYLAKHYLTADSKPEKSSKKRKRKDGVASGFIISDDDVLGWNRNGTSNADDDAPLEGELLYPPVFIRLSHSMILI